MFLIFLLSGIIFFFDLNLGLGGEEKKAKKNLIGERREEITSFNYNNYYFLLFVIQKSIRA